MDDKNEVLDAKNYDDRADQSLSDHYKNAIAYIAKRDYVKANEELEFVYRLNPNSGYYYFAKLLIEFGFASIEELKEKSDSRVTSSPYFINAEKYGDERIRKFLDSLKNKIVVRTNEEKLKSLALDQLLKLYKVQKENNIDSSSTQMMIEKTLDNKFRYVNADFVNLNGLDEAFFARLNTADNAYEACMSDLKCYSDINDINYLANQCEEENSITKKYILSFIGRNLETYQEKGCLQEAREYVQNNYFSEDAKYLLQRIDGLLYTGGDGENKLRGKHLGLIVSTSVIGVSLVALAAGALGYYFLTNSTTVDGVKYVKNENGYTISSIDNDYLSSHNGIITLKDEIGGKPVTGLSRDAFYSSDVKKINNFPDTITSIPDNAFYNCTSLEKVEINTNSELEVIGDSAFENCYLLTTLTFPNNLKKIGSNSFAHCEAINDLIIPNSVTVIGNNAFNGTENLVNLTNNSNISNTEGARVGLNLRTITIVPGEGGSTVTKAPTTYYSWDEISLPFCNAQDYGTFTTYDIDGFNGEINVEDNLVKFRPKGLKSITATAVYEYKDSFKYGYVTYELSTDRDHYIIKNIDKTDENGKAVTSVTIASNFGGKKVSELSSDAFKNNKVIRIISNMSSNLEEIPDYAFEGCSSLTNITFASVQNSRLLKIGTRAFADCTSLEGIEIPNAVNYIGQNAFFNTPKLINFTNYSKYDFENKGSYLGLTMREITYDLKNVDYSLTSLTKNYYVCNSEIEIALPTQNLKKIAILYVNDKEVSVGDDNIIKVSTQNKTSISIVATYEYNFVPNVSGKQDGNYGLRINSGAIAFPTNYKAEFSYIVSLERQSNGQQISLSEFGDVEVHVYGSNGNEYAVTVDKSTGECSFQTGSVDNITVNVKIKTKISNQLLDETTRTFAVLNEE